MKHLIQLPLGKGKLSFSAPCILWLFLLLAALLFAQALKMAVSHMLFLFVLLMPIGALLQIAIAYLSIRISLRVEESVLEKNTYTTLTAVISNHSIFPFPFLSVTLLLPDEKEIACTKKELLFSLTPFAACTVSRRIRFRFRGAYQVGVCMLTVSDCFRAICLHIPCRYETELFVLPRRFEFPPKSSVFDSDFDARQLLRASGSDNTELSDIRAYRDGDSLTRIHWKLSSKSEELIVRDDSRSGGNTVAILCDLEPHFSSHIGDSVRAPLPEYADSIDMLSTDLVMEACIATALRELKAGNNVTLLWFENFLPQTAELRSTHDFDAIYRRFATAPLDTTEKQLTRLMEAYPAAAGMSLFLVTAYLDPATAAEYAAFSYLPSGSAKPPELLYCADDTLFVDDSHAAQRQADCVLEIERAGISVVTIPRFSS